MMILLTGSTWKISGYVFTDVRCGEGVERGRREGGGGGVRLRLTLTSGEGGRERSRDGGVGASAND